MRNRNKTKNGDCKRGMPTKEKAANSENGQKVEKANYKINCIECGLIWKWNLDIKKERSWMNTGIWDVDMEKDGENKLERQDVERASTRSGGRKENDDERDYEKKKKVDRERWWKGVSLESDHARGRKCTMILDDLRGEVDFADLKKKAPNKEVWRNYMPKICQLADNQWWWRWYIHIMYVHI